jgi:hypothetical protein
MSGLHKFNFKKYCVLFMALIFCSIITYRALANNHKGSEIYSSLTSYASPGNIAGTIKFIQDTVPLPSTLTQRRVERSKDTLPQTDTTNGTGLRRDTVPQIDTFSLRISKDTLDGPVTYQAEDSAVLLVKEQKFILYGKTKTTYKDVAINAPTTIVDQEKNVLTAMGTKDSLGRMITRATFQQGQQNFESESFEYNFKSQKGLTRNTYTKEGELYVKANVSKKVDERTVYVKKGCLLPVTSMIRIFILRQTRSRLSAITLQFRDQPIRKLKVYLFHFTCHLAFTRFTREGIRG